jgi:hypothetical protein
MARETRWMIVKEGRRRLGKNGRRRWHGTRDKMDNCEGGEKID